MSDLECSRDLVQVLEHSRISDGHIRARLVYGTTPYLVDAYRLGVPIDPNDWDLHVKAYHTMSLGDVIAAFPDNEGKLWLGLGTPNHDQLIRAVESEGISMPEGHTLLSMTLNMDGNKRLVSIAIRETNTPYDFVGFIHEKSAQSIQAMVPSQFKHAAADTKIIWNGNKTFKFIGRPTYVEIHDFVSDPDQFLGLADVLKVESRTITSPFNGDRKALYVTRSIPNYPTDLIQTLPIGEIH